MKLKNIEIVVFDLELDIINSLANKHGLEELTRDIAAPEFRNRVSKLTNAARIEELWLPKTIPLEFRRPKRSDLD